MVQLRQINKIIKHINRIKGKKSHYHFNRCRKGLRQNSTVLHDKSTEETRNRKIILQYKGRCIYNKTAANIKFNEVKLKAFL
jgi:tryptophanase